MNLKSVEMYKKYGNVVNTNFKLFKIAPHRTPLSCTISCKCEFLTFISHIFKQSGIYYILLSSFFIYILLNPGTRRDNCLIYMCIEICYTVKLNLKMLCFLFNRGTACIGNLTQKSHFTGLFKFS